MSSRCVRKSFVISLPVGVTPESLWKSWHLKPISRATEVITIVNYHNRPKKKLICNAIGLCNKCFHSLEDPFVDITMCCQFNVPSNTSLWTTRQDVRPKPRSATNLNRLHKQKSDYVHSCLHSQRNACSIWRHLRLRATDSWKPMAWLGISQTRMSWLLPRQGTCANRRNLQNHSHANDANDLHMYIHTYLFLGSCKDTCWPHVHPESTDPW